MVHRCLGMRLIGEKFLKKCDIETIGKSAENNGVLRGMMAAGDLIGTLCDYAGKLVNGEEVPAYNMEPLSYVTVNGAGEQVQVGHDDLALSMCTGLTMMVPS